MPLEVPFLLPEHKSGASIFIGMLIVFVYSLLFMPKISQIPKSIAMLRVRRTMLLLLVSEYNFMAPPPLIRNGNSAIFRKST